jgi:hypothetical protein
VLDLERLIAEGGGVYCFVGRKRGVAGQLHEVCTVDLIAARFFGIRRRAAVSHHAPPLGIYRTARLRGAPEALQRESTLRLNYCTCSTWARTPYRHGAVKKADQRVSISPGAVRETVRATLRAPVECGAIIYLGHIDDLADRV